MADLTGDEFRQQMFDRYRWMMRAWFTVLVLQLAVTWARCRCDQLEDRIARVEAQIEVVHE